MESKMIVKIKEYLNKFQEKEIRVSQSGFIINQFFLEKMIYKIQDDVLSLSDSGKETYLALNLNQVYQIDIGEKIMILFMDNDTQIQLTI